MYPRELEFEVFENHPYPVPRNLGVLVNVRKGDRNMAKKLIKEMTDYEKQVCLAAVAIFSGIVDAPEYSKSNITDAEAREVSVRAAYLLVDKVLERTRDDQ